MWFLPLLVLGAIAVAAAARRSPRVMPPSHQLPPPPPATLPPSAMGPVPGPISVLGEILRIGQIPPPTVVLCAIAEAQAIGRNDLAADIVQAFVEPARARARYERGSCAVARSPRTVADAAPQSFMNNLVVPPPAVPTTAQAPVPGMPPSPAAPASSPTQPAASMPTTDDELMALLNADPARFMELANQSRFASQVPPPSPASPPTASSPVAKSLAPGSPLAGVSDDAWRRFVSLLSRESPEFSSQRHVGQFRQRRDRLSELGINPDAIHGSAAAQRAALDADLVDAHHHAAAGGMLDQLGCTIPIPGREAPEKVTLSGMLGVIQSAGLEGAVSWLERPNDRKRYPHTTAAFQRTNGVF